MSKTSFIKISLVSALLTVSAATMADGKATYDGACSVCHATGVANAPKLGDAAAWEARIATGKDALYETSIKGKGAMPAKGGRADISDADVKAAVDYMIAEASKM